MSATRPRAHRAAHLPAAVATAALALLLGGCSSAPAPTSTSAAEEPIEASLQLGWIANSQNMGPYWAEAQGFFADNGVDVTLVPGGPSVAVEPLIVSGSSLLGVSNLDAVARAVNEGADLKVVGATVQVSPSVILSLASNPITSLDDMVGRDICVQPAGVAMLESIFAANGLDFDSVNVVPAEIDPAPLVVGDCEGFLAFSNNQPLTLELQGIATSTLPLSDYGFTLWSSVLVVRADSLDDESSRTAIQGIVAALRAGWEEALADTDAAAQFIVDGPGASLGLSLEQQTLQAASFVRLIKTEETVANGLLSMSEVGIGQNLTTLELLGVPADASLFDTSILEAIGNE